MVYSTIGALALQCVTKYRKRCLGEEQEELQKTKGAKRAEDKYKKRDRNRKRDVEKGKQYETNTKSAPATAFDRKSSE